MRFVRTLFLALIAFAIVGGTAGQLARSASLVAPATMVAMPCDMAAMPTAATGHSQPMGPCKGLTPGCIEQMGCIVDVAIPVRMAAVGRRLPFGTIDWWQARSTMSGTDRTPDPMPPRTT